MKVFFAYERDFSNRWTPVVYYGEVPKLKKHDAGRRSTVWPVTADEMDGEEPKFGILMKNHPAPAE